MSGPSGRVHLVVSYFRDRSRYPRSGPAADQDRTYWANIAVNAATLRHVAGPDPTFTVFAAGGPPADVGVLLDAASVEVRLLDFAHRPPSGFYERYVASLYLLDTMAALQAEVEPDDVLCFVDPDIVWVAPLDPLVAEVRRGGVVAYDLHVPESVPMCDLSRRAQSEVLAEVTGRGPGPGEPPLTHFGGELYGMLGAELAGVVAGVEVLWEATLTRFEQGRPHYTVEEHVLNALLWQRGEQTGRANPHIERIRTLPRPMGTRERAHEGLVAWHLPLEKDTGFLRVFAHLSTGGSLPADLGEHRRWLARRMGVRPTGLRWLLDRARQLRWLVDGRWRSHGAAARYGL